MNYDQENKSFTIVRKYRQNFINDKELIINECKVIEEFQEVCVDLIYRINDALKPII